MGGIGVLHGSVLVLAEGDRMTCRVPLSEGADGSSGQLGERGAETIHNRLICK